MCVKIYTYEKLRTTIYATMAKLRKKKNVCPSARRRDARVPSHVFRNVACRGIDMSNAIIACYSSRTSPYLEV